MVQLLKRIHIQQPLGVDGKAPFSPVIEERRRVWQNINMILMIEPGEWPGEPLIGTPMARLIDQPARFGTEKTLAAIIKGRIIKWEPHVAEPQVTVTRDDDAELGVGYIAEIFLLLLRTQDTLNITVTLEYAR